MKKIKNKILFLILFLLTFIVISCTIAKFERQEVFSNEKIDLSRMNSTILINSGDASEWDENIREMGNIVYDSNTKQYFFFYSGYNGEYKQNNVFVGMAYSEDGITWKKYGQVTNFSAEDPYVVLKDGTFYMFYEDKDEVPFRRISLATSQDAKNWTILKRGVINPERFILGWQSQDVSSPLVIKLDNQWIMLYEGRGFLNQGKIGYATSTDLINWKKMSRPIFGGGSYWDDHVVPDDILKEEDYYILSYHGYSKKNDWQSGLAVSKNMIYWHPMFYDPISQQDTIMISGIDSKLYFLEESDKNIKIYLADSSLKDNFDL